MTDLTLTNPTFDTNAPKFGSGALNGGYGATPTVLITQASDFTIEVWVKAASAPGAFGVIGGQGNALYFRHETNGNAGLYIGNTPNATVDLGVSISDGLWHHLEAHVDFSTDTVRAYVDGVEVYNTTFTTNHVANMTFDRPFTLRTVALSSGAGSYQFNGAVDGAAVWDGLRHTAGFTPSSAAYAGDEAGLIALWQLDSDGVDTAGATAEAEPDYVEITPDDAGLVYSPYTWDIGATQAKSITPGAYIRANFTGDACTLTFDPSGPYAPNRIKYRIDGQAWVYAVLDTEIICEMPEFTALAPSHTLELVFSAIRVTDGRWATQQPALKFTGLRLPVGASLGTARQHDRRVLFLGDSITEGIRTRGGTDAGSAHDAQLSWSWQLGAMIGAEFGNVGYGSLGINALGTGNVPVIGTSWNQMWDGLARDFTTPPDLVVVMIGANDGGNDTTAGWTTFLDDMLAQLPGAMICVIKPFSGSRSAQSGFIQSAIAASAAPERVIYLDGDYFALSHSVDSLHPYGWENIANIAPALADAILPVLNGPGVAPLVTQLQAQDRVTLTRDGAVQAIDLAGLQGYLDSLAG
ncbi:hypothetical protein BFP70_05235 [Thioclava sp. SK-1]|uniref:LamG-like jellyroll fold domain-containing protein n=1 Tax=Thioclava sp. SK-1 TaxID=1889770 RepID=UPI000824D553|nr:LamG-like jellyroll fold domain-containing protein [Thioclava sp. SK-1]OCX66425.1 hypothetical protein BFP70_05235 [Thioclava sp. SK-1]